MQARDVRPVWPQHGRLDSVGNAAGDNPQGLAIACPAVCVWQQVSQGQAACAPSSEGLM
jgi:hypothetical protein